MELDHNQCYQLVRARDRRYDGLFYTTVLTTGIYCRPVCPARTPKVTNVAFVRSAAEAEAEGFRPCKRCRPERAPGGVTSQEPSGVLASAVARLSSGEWEGASVTTLAAGLGVSDRHLRRLFRRHLGATPTQVARTLRLGTARRLLEETDLPVTELAFAAGFSSLRTRQRARTIQELSRQVANGQLTLGRRLDKEALMSISGIGPWTVGYLAMRVAREPDALPEGDLVLKRMAGGADQLRALCKRWSPWRAYAAMALWRKAAQCVS